MRLIVFTLAEITVATASFSVQAATPEEELVDAENTFRFQDYKAAESLLRKLLYPEIRLTHPDHVIKAREYLGACYFWLKDYKRMEEEFTALLTIAPNHKLDPFYYPPSLIERFETLRKRLIELHIISLEEPKPKEEAKCEREEKTIIRRSRIVSFLPFGIGHFQNEDTVKGALFLTGELLTLGLNIGSYIAAESLRGSDGFYSTSDAEVARRLVIVQYVSLGVFAGLVLWDIVDSAMHFIPEESKVRVVPCTAPAGAADVSGALCIQWLGF